MDQHKSSGQFEVFRGTQLSNSNVSQNSANFIESSFAKELTKRQLRPYDSNMQAVMANSIADFKNSNLMFEGNRPSGEVGRNNYNSLSGKQGE